MRAEGLKYVEYFSTFTPPLKKILPLQNFCVIISNIWHAQNRTQGRKDVCPSVVEFQSHVQTRNPK